MGTPGATWLPAADRLEPVADLPLFLPGLVREFGALLNEQPPDEDRQAAKIVFIETAYLTDESTVDSHGSILPHALPKIPKARKSKEIRSMRTNPQLDLGKARLELSGVRLHLRLSGDGNRFLLVVLFGGHR